MMFNTSKYYIELKKKERQRIIIYVCEMYLKKNVIKETVTLQLKSSVLLNFLSI